MSPVKAFWHRKCPLRCASSATFRLPLSRVKLGGRGLSDGSNTLSNISSASCSFSGALFVAVRFVQFEQTSATLRGINTRKRATAAPWITKSTKDYMSEVNGHVASVNPVKDKLQRESKARRDRFTQVAEETDRIFDTEMDRFRYDDARRWRKGIDFFKRQGIAFTLFYVSAYLGCLFGLYIGFATGFFKKEAAYEYMYFFLGGYVEKEWFYSRVEAWGTYINFGFAFVINEMLEFIRLPFMIYTFYTFRPYLTRVNRRVKPSIFRWNAAES
ncbi:uncharacterized protein TEOVI_000386500 [Trypanosoma equiperdum]|uniref:DUF1279 domain-containing protein n=3 Tax=Trypanozoon TaxID=39700 RepID=D0A692_TRYB9|nr:hypothetical protein, conserved [Trypanosoma brucei gambiense DAL972]RHW68229.1 hypothetical protein DPX39_110034600 [Trypanosoma brucei equiperdum]CBH17193.1 hypothetical protein, conserved [Trypanosoma brucei gambiense DAL972]SCU72289.1 hypothetical protein, conserved [Trypanosoma equiperdum]|eukprot:XP_011779457.1 hypothetical protein, conserved [Trypanosoma brucei gambiense DAL972]